MRQEPLTQQQIDTAIRQSGQLRQEKTVSLKNVTGGLAIGGALSIAVFKFWFSAVSALPFMYTKDWHDTVQTAVAKIEPALTEIAVVQANQANVATTLAEIRHTQERQADTLARQADDISAIRRLLERRDERRASR